MIHFHYAFNPPLIQPNVRGRRNRHETVRLMSLGIELWLELPIGPTVIVFGDGKAERSMRLRFAEPFVAPLAREESRKKRVIGLANHQKMRIALALFFNKNHATASCTANCCNSVFG